MDESESQEYSNRKSFEPLIKDMKRAFVNLTIIFTSRASKFNHNSKFSEKWKISFNLQCFNQKQSRPTAFCLEKESQKKTNLKKVNVKHIIYVEKLSKEKF